MHPPPLILLSASFLPQVQLPLLPFLLTLHPALYNSPTTTNTSTPKRQPLHGPAAASLLFDEG